MFRIVTYYLALTSLPSTVLPLFLLPPPPLSPFCPLSHPLIPFPSTPGAPPACGSLFFHHILLMASPTCHSHSYMGLVAFTIHARVDEMSLVAMEGNSAALLYCPCYEW